jgi:hypothetical protein
VVRAEGKESDVSTTNSYWRRQAALAIVEAHAALPDDCTLAERKKAIDAAYPFGQRKYHPYKMWLLERRLYLIHHGERPASKAIQESPLERMMRRSGA